MWVNVCLHARRHVPLQRDTARVSPPGSRRYNKKPDGFEKGLLMMNASMHHLAIRFGRMPQAEKLKLKAESRRVEKEEMSPMLADHKILVRQIHEAYMKNFNMNKAKARLILTGKTSKPVTEKIKTEKKQRKRFKRRLYVVSSPTNILSSCRFPSSPLSFTTWRRSSWQRGL